MENENVVAEEDNPIGCYLEEVESLSAMVKKSEVNDLLSKFGLGYLYSVDGEARITIERKLGIEQNGAVDFFNFGVLAIEKNDLKEAEAAFKKAIKLDENYASPHYNLALIFEDAGVGAKAKKEWQVFIEKEEAYLDSQGIRISTSRDDFDYLAEAKERIAS